MNVLSLFDGISCGQIALSRSCIRYTQYYASEIDKYSIKVTQHNFPNTIQIGDIKCVNGHDLPKIDLLIGGSPCQGFSFAGKLLNFNDQRSKLFFEYLRVLRECKEKNKNMKFLFENVRMKKEYQDIISEYLGIEPVKINSALVSAQNRVRLYWTNINDGIIPQPTDRSITFRKELKTIPHGYIKEKTKVYFKYPSICAQSPRSKYICTDGTIITPEHYEFFQNVPKGYTNIVSNTQRYKMLGNGWTVNVITHILSYLPDYFKYRRL